MIRYLAGHLRHKDLKTACILCGGVGYHVQMPLGQLAALGEQGAPVEVHVHTHLREGALELFGFADETSLFLFERLISVTGVGPKSAIGILSGLDAGELLEAVIGGDEKRLTKAPGVGKKTAARIILELRDKLRDEGVLTSAPVGKATGGGGVLDDLRSALENLGYKPAQVDRALGDVKLLADEGAPLEALVKEALKRV